MERAGLHPKNRSSVVPFSGLHISSANPPQAPARGNWGLALPRRIIMRLTVGKLSIGGEGAGFSWGCRLMASVAV